MRRAVGRERLIRRVSGGGTIAFVMCPATPASSGRNPSQFTPWAISTSLPTSSGRHSATSSPTSAPSLHPTRCARSIPSASMNAIVSWAMIS